MRVAPALLGELDTGVGETLVVAGGDALVGGDIGDVNRVAESALFGGVIRVAALGEVVGCGDLLDALGKGGILPEGEGVGAAAGLRRVSRALVVALVDVDLLATLDVAAVADTPVGESSVAERVAWFVLVSCWFPMPSSESSIHTLANGSTLLYRHVVLVSRGAEIKRNRSIFGRNTAGALVRRERVGARGLLSVAGLGHSTEQCSECSRKNTTGRNHSSSTCWQARGLS